MTMSYKITQELTTITDLIVRIVYSRNGANITKDAKYAHITK